MSSSNEFLFDEFFTSEDEESRLVEVPITIMGRKVPVTLKKGLNVEEKMAAQKAALVRKTLPNGTVSIDVDEGILAEEMLVQAIARWPFVNRETHEPVPVTRENLRRLRGGADEISLILQRIEAEGEKALAPFVTPSEKD